MILVPPGVMQQQNAGGDAYTTTARHLARDASVGAYYTSTQGLWTGNYSQATFIVCIYPLSGERASNGYELASSINDKINGWGYSTDGAIGLNFRALPTVGLQKNLQVSTGLVLPLNQWSGLGLAFNASTAKIVVNGVDLTVSINQWSGNTFQAQNASGNVFFGDGQSGRTLRSYVCQIWGRPVYHDIATAGNWAKFFTGPGKNIPIDLGPTGAIPFGVQPTTFAPDGNLAANLGSLANWSHTAGTVPIAPISPTD